MKKKVLSTILAASMVMGLAACGSTQEAPAATNDTQQSTETTATEAPAADRKDTESRKPLFQAGCRERIVCLLHRSSSSYPSTRLQPAELRSGMTKMPQGMNSN